jgi:abortive infection bacteriophage resistance protein
VATFSKVAESPAVLLAKLVTQKLVVADTKLAEQYINFIGHYRLKGYWYRFVDLIDA